MLHFYDKTGKRIDSSDPQKATLVLVSNASSTDEEQICDTFKIDNFIFDKHNSAAEVSLFHPLENCQFKDAQLLVTFDLQAKHSKIEADLIPIIAIFNQEKLIVISAGQLDDFQAYLKTQEKILSINSLVTCLLLQNSSFSNRLKLIKKEIDQLDKNARQTTKTSELKRVTDLTRELVYLEHTVDDQTTTIKHLAQYLIDNKLIKLSLISELTTSQLRLEKTINIYTDLLESISSLFSAMMDSHLNHLMKYLDSVALLISIPALISGIWGMNVGGLPGKDQEFGFWAIIAFGIIVVIISAFILSRKKYLDD